MNIFYCHISYYNRNNRTVHNVHDATLDLLDKQVMQITKLFSNISCTAQYDSPKSTMHCPKLITKHSTQSQRQDLTVQQSPIDLTSDGLSLNGFYLRVAMGYYMTSTYCGQECEKANLNGMLIIVSRSFHFLASSILHPSIKLLSTE